MKNIKIVLILIISGLFFTACQKDETPETFDSISGVLTPGEDVTTEDLQGLKIYLGRFHDMVDYTNINFNIVAIDSVSTTAINADGTFAFNNLTPGNYGLALEEGYIFSNDTALLVQLDMDEEIQINKSVERYPLENALWIGSYNDKQIGLKKVDLSSMYQLKQIHVYADGVETATVYDIPSFTDVVKLKLESPFEVVFETWVYDQSGNVTEKFNSERIPFYNCMLEDEAHSHVGNLIDIKWIPHFKSRFCFWGKEKKGYYQFSDHQ